MMKMELNLTIRRMLTGLVITGVLVTLLLALISLWSNNRLMKSHKRLTEIALPLDASTQKVKTVATAFTMRTQAIRDASTLEELEKLGKRQELEQSFTAGISRLRWLSEQTKTISAIQKVSGIITELEKFYDDTLGKDTAIFESASNCLKMEDEIQRQVAILDEQSDALQSLLSDWTEAFSGKLGQDADTAKDADSDAVPPFAYDTGTDIKDMTRQIKARNAVNDFSRSVAFLNSHGHQILLAREADEITSMKADRIARAEALVKSALKTLSGFTTKPKTSASASGTDSESEDEGPEARRKNLSEIFQEIKDTFSHLMLTLTRGDRSIASLQTWWLAEKEKTRLLNTALKKTADALKENLEKMQVAADDSRSMAEKDAIQISNTSEKGIWIITAGAILFMAVIGLMTINRIIPPINQAVSFAATIAKGDLTAEMQKEHDDEIGKLIAKMGEMAHNLNTLIGQVQRSGIQVTSSATELSATSKQQEAVMKTQLESTNYVVQSVGEISSVSEDLVETMQRVAAMSEQTAEFANSGQSDLSQMEEAMHHMENASKSISGKLEAINEKAANITSVVTTITKVADQTNLLSLNAAIEAEKAGEYGRGFTVVAREIRRLADQTAVATLDIDQMVQEMQSAVSAGVMEMDAFITEVQRSAENVGKISMQLSRIIEQVQGLSPSFEGVNESMQFQASKSQQINNSMLSLSEEMQQTVDSLRESFMAIEQLNDAASGLQDQVSRFKVM
ncbi:MAG: hypothetical protein B6245_08105 [Desulfobacteraceae bacterium 4572_88]|nr:MAG: hypothetical protein B6245_08105 [Desulfobacteraceae bacterium 4572_88]